MIAQVAGATGQSDQVVIALAIIGLIGTLGTAILTTVVAILTRQNLQANRDNGQELQRNTIATEQTHALVNGLTEELRTAETGQAHAEGVAAGEAAARERGDQPTPVRVVNTPAEPVPTVVRESDER